LEIYPHQKVSIHYVHSKKQTPERASSVDEHHFKNHSDVHVLDSLGGSLVHGDAVFKRCRLYHELTEITQIQVTRQNNVVNWMKQGSGNDSLGTDDHMLACDAENRYCIVEASAKVWNNVDVYDGCCNNWPLYSLLPSINRVSVYTFGEFSTDPALWPFVFEYYFAKKWLKNGGVKAVLAYGPVVRDDKNHVSTYNYGGASAGRTRRLSKSEILAIVLSAIIVGIGICVGIYFGVVNGDKLKSI